MVRFIDDNERRARLGLRHRLAIGAHASTPLEVAPIADGHPRDRPGLDIPGHPRTIA